jgi:hypothetical protein
MSPARKCIITRDLSSDECPWLMAPLKAGDIVWTYYGPTYGCMSPNGTAMSKELDKTPAFEVPNDAWEVAT